jgi:hypothetical protein
MVAHLSLKTVPRDGAQVLRSLWTEAILQATKSDISSDHHD